MRVLNSKLFEGVDQESLSIFCEYHDKHPDVFSTFVRFANEIRSTGRKRYSARTIMERIRWEVDLAHTDSDFKINDHYTPLYVRLLIQIDPSFDGFFELRTIRGFTGRSFRPQLEKK